MNQNENVLGMAGLIGVLLMGCHAPTKPLPAASTIEHDPTRWAKGEDGPGELEQDVKFSKMLRVDGVKVEYRKRTNPIVADYRKQTNDSRTDDEIVQSIGRAYVGKDGNLDEKDLVEQYHRLTERGGLQLYANYLSARVKNGSPKALRYITFELAIYSLDGAVIGTSQASFGPILIPPGGTGMVAGHFPLSKYNFKFDYRITYAQFDRE